MVSFQVVQTDLRVPSERQYLTILRSARGAVQHCAMQVTAFFMEQR